MPGQKKRRTKRRKDKRTDGRTHRTYFTGLPTNAEGPIYRLQETVCVRCSESVGKIFGNGLG